ncbi:aldo/keto reductase, partial [Vibrio cholerae]|nr:aldo/keto reductase [Vibrio cholerae]
MSKRICLGTAMWGWSVKEIVALNILDRFYESGGRYIDTAYNYPINGEKSKLTYSAKLVSRWIKKSGVNDLKIFFKIGSVTNEKIDTVNLSRENITKMTSLSEELFDRNLYSLMIHWDNREHLSEIKDTLIHLSESCEKKKVRLGLSGIRSTGLYQEIINGMNGLHIDQQVK